MVKIGVAVISFFSFWEKSVVFMKRCYDTAPKTL
jgi:hypothetical protein